MALSTVASESAPERRASGPQELEAPQVPPPQSPDHAPQALAEDDDGHLADEDHSHDVVIMRSVWDEWVKIVILLALIAVMLICTHRFPWSIQ